MYKNTFFLKHRTCRREWSLDYSVGLRESEWRKRNEEPVESDDTRYANEIAESDGRTREMEHDVTHRIRVSRVKPLAVHVSYEEFIVEFIV